MNNNSVAKEQRSILKFMWHADRIDFMDYEHRQNLSDQTVQAVCHFVFGYYDCTYCRLHGRPARGPIEGHHPWDKKMPLSDYKHNQTRKFRQRAIRKLIEEVSQRIMLLCDPCHFDWHHGWYRVYLCSCNGVYFLQLLFCAEWQAQSQWTR